MRRNIQAVIAYYRVSTKRQGESGLGLESQKAAVMAFAQQHGATILAEYTEVETGKCADRPQLAKALAHTKRTGATLVIAKLDRLARNLHFVSGLMESGVDFCAVDNPHATPLTIHILAAVAEDEARRISERTKSALAAARKRGTQLGASNPASRNLTAAARRRGSKAGGQAAKERADEALAGIRDVLVELRPLGYGHIAEVLNQRGERTGRGNKWTGNSVRRAYLRLGID